MIAQSEGKVVVTTFVLQNSCADVLMILWFNQSILSVHAIMKSLIQELCYMQQMQHHKDTRTY